ncbi:tyrosine-type recombinase/integrase [Wenxinia marina]|uniref:tyrosine-type recombinase/integrase n=1 Tax=Wenxinia marina TaxID=390641 RepID=UPI0003A62A6B|nr:site-specific integrase [Wenxinia marina]
MADGTATRRPAKSLTAAFVRTAKTPGKYFDGHGLFLKVDAAGARRWVQRIVIRGKRVEMGLGSADLVTLAEAREAAHENRKVARAGGDPLRAKREAEAVPTFAEATRIVYDINRPSWRNPKHAAQFLSTLETYAFPRIGQMSVADVTAADVEAILAPIWRTKAETARRVRQRIGKVMKLAMKRKWRADDPSAVSGEELGRHSTSQTPRKALPYSDVPAFLAAVRQSKATGATKLAMELLVLTAARSGEIRLARWDEIDLANATWTIPAQRMKAGREHRVPLSDRAVTVLRDAQRLADESGLVFPGTRYGKPLSDATLQKLTRELGFDVHVHGFRSTFRVWAQERSTAPREVAEMALAHVVKNKVEAAYARSDLFDLRRRLMETWAAAATAAMADVVRVA